jgi:hypothetical protein
LAVFFFAFAGVASGVLAQGTQPLVAIHDSEFTRNLDASNSPAIPPTPLGAGTTGLQWWIRDWHYFVLPQSVQESLRSDGTAFRVLGDSNIVANALLTNGAPKYPICISLGSEAISDDEIAPFTNYVAAGGFLLVGSSAFTRDTNGASRGDFAFADALGLHTFQSALTNWTTNSAFTKQVDHRILNHIPAGQLLWRMPSTAEEIPWGTSPSHQFLGPHDLWKVQVADATVLAQGDVYPYWTVKQYGKGCFIYCAGLQPLIGHSSFAPTMSAYMIFRKAIEWAFEIARLPVMKLSPWPYPYDAAFMARRDLENYTNFLGSIEASAQIDFTNGARGDYYFCTGTLRDDAYPAFDTNAIVASLCRAVTNYGSTIGPHNGGLPNPGNTNLNHGQLDYWHWGPDEVLDLAPSGYPDGKSYAFSSLSNAFNDIEGWLAGVTNGLRISTGCYFNSTREDSLSLQAGLGVNVTGELKLGAFPSWVWSSRTPGKKYSFLTEPVSDWFVNGMVAQSLEPWHPPGVHTSQTIHDAVDFYYGMGGLINFYSHTLSNGRGDAGFLTLDYIRYGMNSALHPRMWGVNAATLYQWWLQRSNVLVTASFSTNGIQSVATFAISGSRDTNTAVELVVPSNGQATGIQVFTNGILGSANLYRTNGSLLRLLVGTNITSAQIKYVLAPKAQPDFFQVAEGQTLNIPPPGILTNDTPGLGINLSALLVSGPTNGFLVFNTNGGVSYTPNPDFLGADAFTYKAFDGVTSSTPVSVRITTIPTDVFFSDDFTRPTDPSAIDPWKVHAGNWTITGGALAAGTNNTQTYGNAYLTNVWTDYAVVARIQFPSNAFGGGVGGRLNPVTGSHYAAWIYPENSPGGSSVMKLVKFQSWSSYGYNNSSFAVMAQAALPSVGTNFHDVKLAFSSNQIAAYFDGVAMINTSDVEPTPYLSGGITIDLWTDLIQYRAAVDNVFVLPLVVNDTYVVNEDSVLNVPAPGVLINDSPVYSSNTTVTVLAGPTNGVLTLSTNGAFAYAPATNFFGSDFFSYQVVDGGVALGTAGVSLTIGKINHPPVLGSQEDRDIEELSSLSVTNTATDVDPGTVLTYSLVNPPAGMAITTNGIISWSPSEAQGPSTNLIATRVSDNGIPSVAVTNYFTIVVTEVNSPPHLPLQIDRTINELTLLRVTNTAVDADLPANVLTYTLLNPPAGATISSAGVINWTPSESQGPSTNVFTTWVQDNGSPPFSDTNVFVVTVLEVNSAPVLPSQGSRTINELTLMTVTNTATDSDIPANILTYVFLTSPSNATLSASGVISWVPNESQGPGTYVFKTRVFDNGIPVLSATNTFAVAVNEINSAPTLPVQPNQTLFYPGTLTVTNTASDSDLPANILSYSFLSAPTGAVVSATGIITWTPSAAQNSGTNVFTMKVQDNGSPKLSATNSFTVAVLNYVPFNITAISLHPGQAAISWQSASGSTYRLQYKDLVTNATWTDLPPDVLAQGAATTATNFYGSATQRFYRVIVVP